MDKVIEIIMFLSLVFFVSIAIVNYQNFINIFTILLEPFRTLIDALSAK